MSQIVNSLMAENVKTSRKISLSYLATTVFAMVNLA